MYSISRIENEVVVTNREGNAVYSGKLTDYITQQDDEAGIARAIMLKDADDDDIMQALAGAGVLQ